MWCRTNDYIADVAACTVQRIKLVTLKYSAPFELLQDFENIVGKRREI